MLGRGLNLSFDVVLTCLWRFGNDTQEQNGLPRRQGAGFFGNGFCSMYVIVLVLETTY